jgi:hypothetical protein
MVHTQRFRQMRFSPVSLWIVAKSGNSLIEIEREHFTWEISRQFGHMAGQRTTPPEHPVYRPIPAI